MKVKKLPRDTGPAGWNKLLPEPEPAQVLDHNLNADWVVIGAGFAGLSAARRLSQNTAGDRIVILEAARLAEGPAGRNSGFMIDLPHELGTSAYGTAVDTDRAHIRLNRTAIDFAREAAAEFELDRETFDPSGKVNAAAGAAGAQHNAAYAKHLETLSEPYKRLDAAQMKDITGSDFYIDGLYTPGAVIVQPAAYIRGLAAGLIRCNPSARLFEDSGVVGIERESGSWRVNTAGGSVVAPKIILAVNGHAESFGYFARRLMHIILYASMTRALTEAEVRALGGEPRWSFTPADPMGTTVRRISGAGGHRIVVRNRVSYRPSMEATDGDIQSMSRTHQESFIKRFPGLKDVSMEYRWAGRLCLSWNSVPAFGEVEDGVYSACCQNGLGVAKGTLSGMMAADLATGNRSEQLEQMLAYDPPRRLPPEPFMSIGAKTALRWKEYKARAEL